MNEFRNIIIHKAILHICNMSITSPILSELSLEINDEVFEYLAKHISKISSLSTSKEYMKQKEYTSYVCLN